MTKSTYFVGYFVKKFCWFICWTCWICWNDLLLHLCPSPKQSLFVLLLRGVNSKDFIILLNLLFFHSSPYLHIQQNHTISFLPRQLWENQKHKRIFLYKNGMAVIAWGLLWNINPRLAQFHQPQKYRQYQSPGRRRRIRKRHKTIKRTRQKNTPNTSKATEFCPYQNW